MRRIYGFPNTSSEIPVLLTIFNRPAKTRAVIENLRQVKPKRLFVAADGPRPDCPPDTESCRLAREEVLNIDWDCNLERRFLEHNTGCDPAVSGAIDWFFQHVEYGIILEDDCLVHPDFFEFCAALFERYFNDRRIMQLSSLSPYVSREYPYDYHFSRAFLCGGGWGTWRRAWKYFTPDMHRYGDAEALSVLKSYFPHRYQWIQQYRKFLKFKNGQYNNWDFQWNMACFAQNGLCIVPEKNLMQNIGFDAESTHTKSIDNPIFKNLKVERLHFPLRHPVFVYADSQPQRSLERKIYRSLSAKSRCAYLLRRTAGTMADLFQ